MKKLLALLLACAMLLSLGAALAEDYSTEEVTEKTVTEAPAFTFGEPQERGVSGITDIVTNNNGILTISTKDGLYIRVSEPPEGVFLFTQDYFASLGSYASFPGLDPDDFIEYLKSNDIHVYSLDRFTKTESRFMTFEPDSLSKKIRNFDSLSDTDAGTVAQVLAPAFGCSNGQVTTINGVKWMLLDNMALVTIVNGVYFVAVPNLQEITEDDLTDLATLVSLFELR